MTKKALYQVYIYAISYLATISILIALFIVPMMQSEANTTPNNLSYGGCKTKYGNTWLDCPSNQPVINFSTINFTVKDANRNN